MGDEDTYNVIRREVVRGYEGGVVGKKTELYNLVVQQAKELGVSMEDIVVKVDNNGEYSHGAAMGTGGILTIGGDKLSGNSNLSALRGIIKHEFGHYKQGYFIAKRNDWLSKINISSLSRKAECEADFGAGKDAESMLLQLIKSAPEDYKNPSVKHPAHVERLKAALVKSFIEDNTSVQLEFEDISVKENCEFIITNKEKLRAIPEVVVEAANKNAEIVLDRIDKNVAKYLELEKDGSLNVPDGRAAPLRNVQPSVVNGR